MQNPQSLTPEQIQQIAEEFRGAALAKAAELRAAAEPPPSHEQGGNVEGDCPNCGLCGCVGYWDPRLSSWRFRCHNCTCQWSETPVLPPNPQPAK